jgi:hypothetical protein
VLKRVWAGRLTVSISSPKIPIKHSLTYWSSPVIAKVQAVRVDRCPAVRLSSNGGRIRSRII